MNPIPFREQTNELGPPRGWPTGKCRSLPVHQGLAPYPSDGVEIPVTISCWQPTDEERAAIAAGKPVWHLVYTAPNGVPPVALQTETPFVEEPPRDTTPAGLQGMAECGCPYIKYSEGDSRVEHVMLCRNRLPGRRQR